MKGVFSEGLKGTLLEKPGRQGPGAARPLCCPTRTTRDPQGLCLPVLSALDVLRACSSVFLVFLGDLLKCHLLGRSSLTAYHLPLLCL